MLSSIFHIFFFFNDTATTEIYTLSLHDALPIYLAAELLQDVVQSVVVAQRHFHPASPPARESARNATRTTGGSPGPRNGLWFVSRAGTSLADTHLSTGRTERRQAEV